MLEVLIKTKPPLRIYDKLKNFIRGKAISDWDAEAAAHAGHLYILKKMPNLPQNIVNADWAAYRGNLEMLRYLSEERGVNICTRQAPNWAAAGGFLEIIQYLETKGLHCEEIALTHAACKGHLDVMKYLVDKGLLKKDKLSSLVHRACMFGHIHILEYLMQEHGAEVTAYQADTAASHGRLEMLQYLKDRLGIVCTSDGLRWAEGGGYMEVIEFIHSN